MAERLARVLHGISYDLKDRHLIINEREAERVREIFRLYLEFGCVKKLKAHLDSHDVRSKIRVTRSGRSSGGTAFSRGALYKVLQNRTYLGEVPHKDRSYPGEHEAIVDREMWEKVRIRMSESIRGKRSGRDAAAPSLLRGLVYDANGNRFTPSHAVKRGKRYRYYVSQRVIKDAASGSGQPGRIPARELENAVLVELKSFFGSADRITSALTEHSDDLVDTRRLIEASKRAAQSLDSDPHEATSQFLAAVMKRIVIRNDSLEIQFNRHVLRACLLNPGHPAATRSSVPSQVEDLLHLEVLVAIKRCRGETRLIIPSSNGGHDSRVPIPSLVKAIARAQDWVGAIVAGEFKDQRAVAQAIGANEKYVSRVIRCAFLTPEIVGRIVRGHHPDDATVLTLLEDIPLSWVAQHERITTANRSRAKPT